MSEWDDIVSVICVVMGDIEDDCWEETSSRLEEYMVEDDCEVD